MCENGLSAETDQIVADGLQLVSMADELDSEISSFDASINGLNGVWSGEAVTALTNAFNEFRPILQQFQERLNTTGNNVQSAGNNLAATEEDITRVNNGLAD